MRDGVSLVLTLGVRPETERVERVPETERVPSGKKSTDAPFLRFSMHVDNTLSWLRASVRFSPMCPVRNMLHPTMGMRNMDVLLTNLNGLRSVKRLNMSRKLW